MTFADSIRNATFATILVVAPASLAADATSVVIETAPLRGIMGHPAVRAEVGVAPMVAAAMAFETSDAASERDDFKDHRRAYQVEGLWYPMGHVAYAPFVAGGLAYAEADVGRQRRRDSVTWARTSSSESHDRWVNHDRSVSTTQSAGVRFTTGYVTTSLRLVRDEVLQQSSKAERDEVKSSNPDLTSAGRAPVTTSLVLHAGVLIK